MCPLCPRLDPPMFSWFAKFVEDILNHGLDFQYGAFDLRKVIMKCGTDAEHPCQISRNWTFTSRNHKCNERTNEQSKYA